MKKRNLLLLSACNLTPVSPGLSSESVTSFSEKTEMEEVKNLIRK